MRNIIFIISLLLISFLSHASIDRYYCEVVNARDVKELNALKLNRFKNPLLTVSFKACRLTKGNAKFDVCKVQGHRLVISVDPTTSVFLSSAGRSYELSCLEGEKPDTRGGQQQEQEQQDGAPAINPGHGGSNIRMRGIKNTH